MRDLLPVSLWPLGTASGETLTFETMLWRDLSSRKLGLAIAH